ncbi:hypothetical protein CXF59_00065, partial [Flavobacterium sp. ALD4]
MKPNFTLSTKIFSSSTFIAFLLYVIIPFSAVGQTPCDNSANQVDLRSSYTKGTCGSANDVILLGATFVAENACNSCPSGSPTTARLKIQVHNNTSSERYLGVFATLKNGAGETICQIIKCDGPLKKSSEEVKVWTDGTTYQEIDYGVYTFTCGNPLMLTNILAVFNTPGGGCPVVYSSSKWCYSTPDILITPPLNVVLNATCDSGNKTNINSIVTGGSGNFTYSWNDNINLTTQGLSNVTPGVYTLTVTDNGKRDANNEFCKVTGSITVNPIATLVLTSGTVNQTVCAGTAITSTIYTWGGGATNVSVTSLPAGLISTIDAPNKTVTISGTPTANGTYSVSTTGQITPCPAISLGGTITVNPLPTLTVVNP